MTSGCSSSIGGRSSSLSAAACEWSVLHQECRVLHKGCKYKQGARENPSRQRSKVARLAGLNVVENVDEDKEHGDQESHATGNDLGRNGEADPGGENKETGEDEVVDNVLHGVTFEPDPDGSHGEDAVSVDIGFELPYRTDTDDLILQLLGKILQTEDAFNTPRIKVERVLVVTETPYLEDAFLKEN